MSVQELIDKLEKIKDKTLPVAALVSHGRRPGEFNPLRGTPTVQRFNEQDSSGDPDPYNDDKVVVLS